PSDHPGMTAIALCAWQIENPLGDNAEHDFRRAAFDRVRFRAQPGARPRAALGALALPLQRINAAGGHQDLIAALVELGAIIFHRRGKRRMTLPGLGEIDRTLGGAGERSFVDFETGDLPAQTRILQTTLFVGADGIGGDPPDRPTDAALAHARNHRALVL